MDFTVNHIDRFFIVVNDNFSSLFADLYNWRAKQVYIMMKI